MVIDYDYNLIAEWRSIDEILPYRQYKSGAMEEEKPVYQNPTVSYSNPLLALEFDILNKEGFGLKRGYYEIACDETYSFLMFVQSGKIKAKIPVIAQETINKSGNDFEWADDKDKNAPLAASKNIEDEITVSSRKIYKKTYSEKEIKKRKKKYQKGLDPDNYFHSKAFMEYDKEKELYKIIWEKYNTRLIGIIKI